jgi:hypothetical protein
MTKFFALLLIAGSCSLALAASRSDVQHHTSVTDDIHTSHPVKAEPAPIELAPVYIKAEKPAVHKPAAKKGCIDYPMYASGDETVRICS